MLVLTWLVAEVVTIFGFAGFAAAYFIFRHNSAVMVGGDASVPVILGSVYVIVAGYSFDALLFAYRTISVLI